MSHWISTSESGILRKNKPAENLEELLVFGYACKVFRDNEKALYIDQGKHLIPWMGDETLKIDRYDCRGALPDLKKYEASREGYDAMRWLGLSESERKLEELCDRERYYALEINEEEEEMYKEEEQKRHKTTAIAYSYDVPTNPDAKEEDTVSLPPEEDEEYVPSPILDVPVDIDIPKTVKEYARIEKTALFVCKQGLQMEILIKAKQSDNPQFSFLTQHDKLYKFYRHVLAALKNGRYQPQQQKRPEEKQEPSQDSANENEHYLHPSLLSGSTQKSEPIVQALTYKPSANCSYSQLVNRIQGGAQSERGSQPPLPASLGATQTQMTVEQQQYYQYVYVQQYYEYYRHMVLSQQGEAGVYAQLPQDFNQLDPNMQAYIQQLAYTQYMQQMQQQQPQKQDNAYAQIVSNLNKEMLNPYSVNVPQLPEGAEITKQPIKYPLNEEKRVVTMEKLQDDSNGVVKKEKVEVKKPLLSLAAYGSDSEESETEPDKTIEKEVKKEEKEVYKVPVGETQIVIDKLAAYVAKNGAQFEEDVRARRDARFEFLNEGHEFNKYYRAKIRELGGEEKVEIKKEEKEDNVKEEEKAVKAEEKSPVKQKKIIAPVSFSIKKPKDDQPKEIKSALPLEESSEDEDNSENVETQETLQKNPKTPSPVEVKEPSETPREAEKKPDVENGSKTTCITAEDDPIIEMINLSNAELKDARRAEDKIKDKLAVAAKEKLAQAAKERALKLERKRKAAAFLKLKAETNSLPVVEKASPASRRVSEDEIPKEIEEIDLTSSPEKERSRSRERRPKKRDRDKRGRTEEEEHREKKRKKEKKKKSHRRKHSRSRHESRSKRKAKKHRRSQSRSSRSSVSS